MASCETSLLAPSEPAPNRDQATTHLREAGGGERRVVVGSAAAFGAWTLVANTATFAGLLFRWAALALPVCVLLGFAVAAGLGQRTKLPDGDPGPSHDSRLIAAGVVAAMAYAVFASYLLWWVIAVLIAIAGCWGSRDSQAAPATTDYRWAVWVQLATALVAVVLTLGLHRGDIDDAFYLRVAQQAFAHPEAAPLGSDAMYGVAGRPLLMDVYRIGAYELMIAAIAWWTGRPVFDVAYLYLPALAALVAIAAWSALLRDLAGRIWPIALVATMVLLVANGEPARSLANFAFVRLFQGKAVFVTVALPALVFIVNRSLAREGPAWRIAANLALVGACGLTAWGLVAAPFVVAVAAIAAAIGGRFDLRRIAALLPGLAYCALVAASIRPGVTFARSTHRLPLDRRRRGSHGVRRVRAVHAVRDRGRMGVAASPPARPSVARERGGCLARGATQSVARGSDRTPRHYRAGVLARVLAAAVPGVPERGDRPLGRARARGRTSARTFGLRGARGDDDGRGVGTGNHAHRARGRVPFAGTQDRDGRVSSRARDSARVSRAGGDRCTRRRRRGACVVRPPPRAHHRPAPLPRSVPRVLRTGRPGSAQRDRADAGRAARVRVRCGGARGDHRTASSRRVRHPLGLPLRSELANHLEARGYRPRAEGGYEIWSLATRA